MNTTPNRSVFISYSRENSELVTLASKLLKAGGATVFLDVTSIEYGAKWQDVLLKAIKECERVLLFWSKQAASSKWVTREWQLALKEQKLIVPMLLDATPLPRPLASFNGMPELQRLLLAPAPPARTVKRRPESTKKPSVESDPDGTSCPISSHIRRVDPRKADVGDRPRVAAHDALAEIGKQFVEVLFSDGTSVSTPGPNPIGP